MMSAFISAGFIIAVLVLGRRWFKEDDWSGIR